MEEKIKEIVKIKTIKSYIIALCEEYENLEDTKEYDELINAKTSILREIRDFILKL